MSERETKLERLLRPGGSCSVLRMRDGDQTDAGGGARNCQTRRRGAGDVFSSTQYPDPSLTFGPVRKLLQGRVTALTTDMASAGVAGSDFTAEVQ